MTEQEVSEAVAAWVQATCPDIETSYSYPVASKLGALPDVVAFCSRKAVGPNHPEFPFSELQQVWMRVFNVEVSIMVEADGDGETAHQQLQTFGAALEASLEQDATLGGQVEMTSPQAEFDYSTPFAEYDDGTRGRLLFVTLTVGELVNEPS